MSTLMHNALRAGQVTQVNRSCQQITQHFIGNISFGKNSTFQHVLVTIESAGGGAGRGGAGWGGAGRGGAGRGGAGRGGAGRGGARSVSSQASQDLQSNTEPSSWLFLSTHLVKLDKCGHLHAVGEEVLPTNEVVITHTHKHTHTHTNTHTNTHTHTHTHTQSQHLTDPQTPH